MAIGFARGSLPILFVVVFVDLVGFGIVIPLLPFYGEHFAATPAEVGVLMASYSFTQFLTAPAWGRLSDRTGRRPVLLVTLAGLSLAYVALAFADSLATLLLARSAAGVMAGNIGVAFAYVADVTESRNRARGMAMMGAAFGLGFIFGPAIGGLLAGSDPAAADFRTPALAAAGLSTAALLLAAVLLPESLSPSVRAHQRSLSAGARWRQFVDALLTPAVGFLMVLAFLANFVFSGLETTFALWSRRQFGWGPEQNGYLFALVGFLTAAVQGGVVGRVARRYGEGRLIVLGAALLALGMGAIPLSTTVPRLVAAMGLIAVGFSFLSPCLNSLLSLQVEEGVQGGTLGAGRSAMTLARILGPLWAGAIFGAFGKDWPFFCGAVIMAVAAVLALRTLGLADSRGRGEPALTTAPLREAPRESGR